MKNHKFYSLTKNDGVLIAIERNGYTDSTYNYYKDGFRWWCIEPLTGHAVCYGDTLEESQKTAKDSEKMVADFKTTVSYKTLCKVFSEARQKAKGLEA